MEPSFKSVGIIAEYNPFHNGHRYQIQEIRRRTGAEYIFIVMGGNFLQRGTPAFADKYLRTRMALSCGADFILELPTVFSTASAETFAYGGVSLLHQLGCVEGICFGTECGNLAPLSSIAGFLQKEPLDYSEKLRSLLASGVSYPSARNKLLTDCFPDIFHALPNLLETPNNILAIEYLKALRRLNSSIIPFTIPRSDYGYYSDKEKEKYLSASAIRKLMEGPLSDCQSQDATHIHQTPSFFKYLPKEVHPTLTENRLSFPLTSNDFSEYLFFALNILEESQALSLSDMSIDLWNRIKKELPDYKDFSSFTEQLKSRQYTYSRVSRVLCHILLQIKTEFLQTSSTGEKIPALYGRLLGLRTEKSPFLRNIRHFPLINKLADAKQKLEQFAAEEISYKEDRRTYLSLAKAHIQTDINASVLYRRALYHKNGTLLPEEHRAGVIRI